MSLPRDSSTPSLHTNFSLYAESSSTRSTGSPSLSRRQMDNATSLEPVSNFVPPKIPGHHSRQNSTSQSIAREHDPCTLLKMAPSIVKKRKGSVLARNTILKMDHFLSGTNTNLDFHLQGAPNFRVADLNVYGVAQPTAIGLSTILAILNCHPKSLNSVSCTWFSTREEPLVYLNGMPYVLREYADPMQNMSAFLGINSVRLEKVEERLKTDIIKEAKALGGLFLVHQELMDGTIVPCYIAADKVQTPKEVFHDFRDQGYRIEYFRIPISPEQAPEDNYFDEYIHVIRNLEPTDPLIFNCGIGAVRTTVGTIIAQIIRRTQLIERGHPDPFPISGWSYHNSSQVSGDINQFVAKGLEEADHLNAKNNALLRLMLLLEQALDTKSSPNSAIQWAMERGPLIENLKEAVVGNYQSIVSLTALLESGIYSKKLLDTIIDQSDDVVNLREAILTNRIHQITQVSSANYNENSYLSKALNGLQRYFFLLCFTAYVNESPNTKFEQRFSSWVRARTEVWSMLQNMRRKGPRLYFFRPVEDLHQLTTHNQKKLGSGMFDMVATTDATVEMENVVINSRTGIVLTSQTILKVDFWHFGYPKETGQERHHRFVIDGASNFRRVDNTHIYGVAQPTVNGLRQVVRNLLHSSERILWINLREEPIIYINGIPYVLRDRAFTVRNLRAYKGITGFRMEQLEEKLKEDVIREVMQCGGRILLHGEDSEGNVMSSWEEVDVQDVMTVREVMVYAALEIKQSYDSSDEDGSEYTKKSSVDHVLEYRRVPITAEKAPEWRDIDDLQALVMGVDLSKTAVIMNDQVGLGRSTTGTIIATLLTRWIRPKSATKTQTNYPNYQIINSLLRVIRHGLENKQRVDCTMEQCAVESRQVFDIIESARVQAEKEKEDDPNQFKRTVKRGITALERYFLFICFQAYLDDTSPSLVSETESFGHWMGRHPELSTILDDVLLTNEEKQFRSLVPVERSLMGDGMALSTEVMAVVNSRHGQVLAQQTIMKHDAFPGCQKMSLKEKIPGAYNFRRIEISKIKTAVKYGGKAAIIGGLEADMERHDEDPLVAPFICGCAMPNKDAIKSILKAMDAGPGGKRTVLWTCLREEPVIYVNKNPYVLRLFMDPIKNLETTGISKDRVESMEDRMKLETLQELKMYDGRLLLHDEEAGSFNLMPIWETVPPELVETPAEVFSSIQAEGYQVNYIRIPITDEQAPIPDVFDQLIHRMHEANQGHDILFNCQMGRGRTTTGMVVASLLSMILSNDAVSDMSDSFIADNSNNNNMFSVSSEEENDESHEERERYQNGEYRVILQLVSVLSYGKRAKRLTDRAINMCDHMQNLRKAIYDYKLRLEAVPDHGSKKWKSIHEVAMNYLVRYFYLIVFANYLLEEMGSIKGDQDETSFKEAKKLTTFKQWLKGRREIVNIISLQSFDLS
ncbi:hypothetical protein G6F56_000086 [Rhizopus delemar]|nr:hypothetical protein G6F56_000086 [Rhizopus delemar]